MELYLGCEQTLLMSFVVYVTVQNVTKRIRLIENITRESSINPANWHLNF